MFRGGRIKNKMEFRVGKAQNNRAAAANFERMRNVLLIGSSIKSNIVDWLFENLEGDLTWPR